LFPSEKHFKQIHVGTRLLHVVNKHTVRFEPITAKLAFTNQSEWRNTKNLNDLISGSTLSKTINIPPKKVNKTSEVFQIISSHSWSARCYVKLSSKYGRRIVLCEYQQAMTSNPNKDISGYICLFFVSFLRS